MNSNNILEILALGLASKVVTMLHGRTGVGKTRLTQALARSPDPYCCSLRTKVWGDAEPVNYIEIRASQIEASDVMGIPSRQMVRTDTGEYPVTVFAPIDVMPGNHNPIKKGIVFVDEYFRARFDVLNAIFQLPEVLKNHETGELYHRVGTHVFPSGYGVIAATNPLGETGDYDQTSVYDKALLSRFSHVKLNLTLDYLTSWAEFMRKEYGTSKEVEDLIYFATSSPINLLGDDALDVDLGFHIKPNPRAWEMVQRVIITGKRLDFSSQAIHTLVRGLVGQTVAAGLIQWSPKIRPVDIVQQGTEAWEKEVENLSQAEKEIVLHNLYVFSKTPMQDKQKQNYIDFYLMALTKWDTTCTPLLATLLHNILLQDANIIADKLGFNGDQTCSMMINLLKSGAISSYLDELATAHKLDINRLWLTYIIKNLNTTLLAKINTIMQ